MALERVAAETDPRGGGPCMAHNLALTLAMQAATRAAVASAPSPALSPKPAACCGSAVPADIRAALRSASAGAATCTTHGCLLEQHRQLPFCAWPLQHLNIHPNEQQKTAH